MLSKISQTEKDKYHMISLTWNLKQKKKKVTTNTENEWIGGCQGCRVGVQQDE